MVGLTDLALAPLAWAAHGRVPPRDPRRILVLRLERIGDLLMTLPALDRLRHEHPRAEITLVVGSWNRDIARLYDGATKVETLDLPWLARDGRGPSWPALVRAALAWRGRFDAVVNFEPDIRSNFLAFLSGAPCRLGFDAGGGAAFLTHPRAFDAKRHTTENALRLVEDLPSSAPEERSTRPRAGFRVSDDARASVATLLGPSGESAAPLLVVHASGGRAIKQWPPERFGAATAELALEMGAVVAFTGAEADRPLVDAAMSAFSGVRPAIELCGRLDLAQLAALVERAALVLCGDTGPMHLASALARPVVAVFGPSQPVRYGPIGAPHRVVRVDLPCSPCNRIRQPPARCTGHTPDCLAQIDVAAVVAAGRELLFAVRDGNETRARAAEPGRPA